jgi:hypothetical protein
MGIFHKLQSVVKTKPTVESQPQWAAEAIREAVDASSDAETKLNALLQEARDAQEKIERLVEEFRWKLDSPSKHPVKPGTGYCLYLNLTSAIDDLVQARIKEDRFRRGDFS